MQKIDARTLSPGLTLTLMLLRKGAAVLSDTLCWTLSPYSRHQSQALSGRPAVWFDDNTDCLICKICINHPTVHIQQSGLENTFRKRETY